MTRLDPIVSYQRYLRWQLLSWHEGTRERLLFWLVWKLPRRIVSICGIRLWVHGTTGRYAGTDATSVTMGEVLARWEGRR